MPDIDFEKLEPIEIPHEFVTELGYLVVVNHKLTLEAIDRDENEELEKLEGIWEEDHEAALSLRSDLQRFYEGLRKAANSQAAVALVTRIQHWISRFARKVPGKPKTDGSKLVKELDHLNGYFGEGPVPITFFAELVNVRDSVIHGDSKAQWQDQRGNPRRVAECYANASDETEIDEDQLNDAVAKATKQVEWYDDKLRKPPGDSPPR